MLLTERVTLRLGFKRKLIFPSSGCKGRSALQKGEKLWYSPLGSSRWWVRLRKRRLSGLSVHGCGLGVQWQRGIFVFSFLFFCYNPLLLSSRL